MSRPAAARALLRRHGWFAAAATAGAALRVITMLGFPPAIWFGGDSASYLSTALRYAPGTSRLSGYGVLLAALRPLHSFAVVTAVQHLMGLAIAAGMYALLRRSGLPGWGATLAALPVLLSAYQVQLEQEILPSASFCFLVVTAVVITLWGRDSRPPQASAAAVGGLLALSACFWPVGLPLLMVFLAVLAVRRAGWQALAAATAAAVLPLAGYLAWFDHAYHRVAFSNSDGIYLWSRTMSFANCAVIKPPPSEAGLCPPRAGRRAAASAYIWAPGSPLDRLPGKKFSAAKNARAMNFALRAIAAQPVGYLTAVLHDVSLAFRWTIPAHPSALMIRRYEFRYATQPWIPPGAVLVPGHTVASDQRAYGGETGTRAVPPFAGWMIAYQRAAYLPGTLLAAILAIGLGGIAGRCRGRWRRDGGEWGGPGLYPWLAAAAVLVVPVLTADYSPRYVLVAVPLACLAAGLAFARPPAPADPPTATDKITSMLRGAGQPSHG